MAEKQAVPASSIYIAAPEGDTGKSTIALGILHRLNATVARVGVFRPITRVSGGDPLRPASPRWRSPRVGEERYDIAELLLAHATAGLPYQRCVGVTYQQLHWNRDAATGESGTGADVDKVRAATELVRARAPQLLVEGPI